MIKQNRIEAPKAEGQLAEKKKIVYASGETVHWSEKLARNLALAGMLVLTVTAVRNARLPSGATVLTAVQEMVDTDWDDHLGKISFVSNLLPETVAVFFESPLEAEWVAPCFGEVDHPWSQAEPYVGYAANDRRVFAIAPGQVMSLAHGPEEELILRVRQEDGIEALYYNLAFVNVSEGDTVSEKTCLGEALPEGALVEVRRAGRAIDPTAAFSPRSEDSL